MPVGVLGCSLELADGADLDSVLSGVAGNSWGENEQISKKNATNAFNVSLSVKCSFMNCTFSRQDPRSH